MGEKGTQGIKSGSSSIGISLKGMGGYSLAGTGYSIGSTRGYSLVNTGYSLGNRGYSLGKQGYSTIKSKGYAPSSEPTIKGRGYGDFSFKNNRFYGSSLKNHLQHVSMIDLVEEELKKYKKKRYDFDLESRVGKQNYRFN